MKDDPRQAYFFESLKTLEPALPVLKHITNKVLRLTDYSLKIGHCQGIAKACETNKDLVRRLALDNCGLTDDSFSVLLGGLSN